MVVVHNFYNSQYIPLSLILIPVGFMHMEALKQIFHKTRFACNGFSLLTVSHTHAKRLLIPSLLPTEERDSCVIFPNFLSLEESVSTLEKSISILDYDSKQTYAPIYQLLTRLDLRCGCVGVHVWVLCVCGWGGGGGACTYSVMVCVCVGGARTGLLGGGV